MKGTECLNNKIFIDTDVNIAPNGSISTVESYRGKSQEVVNNTLYLYLLLSWRFFSSLDHLSSDNVCCCHLSNTCYNCEYC